MGPEKYLLRWRFEYKDGSAKYGQWSPGGTEGEASRIDKTNLACAKIEAKDILKRDVFTLVECPAEDFVVFRWISLQSVHMGGRISMGQRRVVGLKILTRSEGMEAYSSGDVRMVALDDGEKMILSGSKYI